MSDLIPAKDGIFERHPLFFWIPACAGMTNFGYLTDGVILTDNKAGKAGAKLKDALTITFVDN
jgi:hypothetical protein